MIKKTLVYMMVVTFIFLNFTYSTHSTYETDSILFVGGTGEGNFSSINEALDNSTDGDIIYVYNGSYNERLVLNKSVSLLGENKNDTIFSGRHNFNILNLISSNVTVQGFLFINSSNAMLISNDCKNIFINDNVFYNNSNGILSEESNINVTIKCNSFINNSEGIRFYNTSNSLICDNYFFGAEKGEGIILRNKSNFNNISKNRIFFTGTGILNQGYSNNNVIISNNVSSNYVGVSASFCADLFIFSNELYNNSRYAVYIDNSGFFNVTNNSVIMNNFGIYLKDCYNYSDIENNIFIDNAQDIRIKNKPPVIKIPSFEMTVFIILLFLSFLVFYIVIKKYEKK